MARTTKLRSGAVIEDTIEDKDGDTKVTVEESSDEDKIRFDTAGSQRMIIDETGKVGIGTDAPDYALDVAGDIGVAAITVSPTEKVNKKAISFDGTNDVVIISDQDEYSPTDGSTDTAFSISAWVYVGDVSEDNGPFVAKSNNTISVRNEYIFKHENGEVQLFIYDSTLNANGNQIRAQANAATLSDATWHHVVATYDGSTNASGITLYTDASQTSATNNETGTYVRLRNSSTPLTFGATEDAGNANRIFEDRMADVVFFNKELSSAEVTEIYNSGKVMNVRNHSAFANVVSWWKMGDDQDTDSSSGIIDYVSGYHGTLTNGASIIDETGLPSDKLDSLSTNASGSLGVGIKNPDETLHVYGSAKMEGDATITGKLGIGTTSPSSELTINGTQPALTLRESDADRAEIAINDSDNLVITNQSTNKYIVFKTNDAGVTREGFRIGGVTPEVVVNEGSDSLIDFRVESNNNTHMLFVDGGNEKVGIGLELPQTTLHVHADSIENGTVTISQSDDSGDASQLDIAKSRGSGAQPADVQSGDFVGQVRFLGYEGSSYQNFADIYAQAAGTIDAANHPTKVVIRTTPLGGTTPVSAVTIDENQNLTAAGGVYGKMRHMTHHRYNDGSGTGKEYIPWVGTSEQASPSYITQGVAPYSGRLVAVWVRSAKTGGLGSTSVAIHIGVNGDTVVNSAAEETITVDMNQQNTSYAFDFTASTHFAAGDVIGVAIDPTNQHGNVNVTCIWEYTITA